jgi:hypothetical protein
VVEVKANGTQTTVDSGLSSPTGVAVDGAGDVFIADTLNNRVVEVKANGTQTTVDSGLSSPTGVAVDGAGDAFIADEKNNRVVEVKSHGTQTTVGSGFSFPYGVAVDDLGDVFIADTGNNRVVEVKVDGTQTTVGAGLNWPRGVAADGAGDVFIADENNGRVLKVTAGVPVTVSAVTASIVVTPYSLTYDGAAHTAGGTATGIGGVNLSADLSLSGTSHTGAGTYTDTWTFHDPNGDYLDASGMVSDSISPATLTVTAAHQTKVYGSADPALTYSATGFQSHDTAATVLSGGLTRVAGEAVGAYAIGRGTLAANSNYTIAFTGNSLAITPATLTVTAAPQTKVYGSPDPALTYAASGFKFTDTGATVLSGGLTRAAGAAVGSYAIGQGTLAANSNYTIAFTGNSLAITPATLTVTADPQTKVYGSAHPALTYAASGFKFTDTAATVLSGGLTRAAGETVAGGPYAIGQGTLVANSNYTIAFTGSSLAITPATLTVTADPQSKVYGSPDPALTYAVSGLQFSDTAATVLSGGLTRAAGETVAGSPYAIGQGTLAANSNYTIAFTGNSLAITPATLTVTAAPQTKVYASADPALTYAVSGLQFSDTAATVLTGGLTRAAGETVAGGPYAISQGTLAANSNYTIAFTGNSLAITPATLTVTPAAGQSKVYGAAMPALTYTFSGLVNNDPASTLTGSLGTTATAASPVGTYAFTLGTLSAGSNYTAVLAANAPTFAVTPATLTVTAGNASRYYGVANPAFTYTITGFVNNDPSSVVSGTPTLTTPATAGSAPGSYPITAGPGTLSAANYTFSLVNATLTVSPAPLSASAANFSATAGAPFSGTVATFTNADPYGGAASYTAVITWGDGSTSAGVISGTGSTLTVTGSHTYADPVNESVSVQISHKLGYTTTAMVSDIATVTSLGQGVQSGQAGGIGFWHNNNGQALINSFNGGSTSTALATWLALSFPNLYGASAGANNLTGKSNAQVAAFYLSQFNLSGNQVQAQVLATALNVYATTASLGGNAGVAYGFTVSATGLGARSYNVGSDGAAFGVANNTTWNVYELLLAVNKKAVNGVLYGGNTTLQAQCAGLFNSLDQAGGIG